MPTDFLIHFIFLLQPDKPFHLICDLLGGLGLHASTAIVLLRPEVLAIILLGEEKYGPGSEPQWKAGGARYPNLYKALLEEPSRTLRTKLLEDIPSGKTGDGRNTRRPARARIRNQ